MELKNVQLGTAIYRHVTGKIVNVIAVDCQDGASLIVEALDDGGDIWSADIFRTEAHHLEPCSREYWNSVIKRPVVSFEEATGVKGCERSEHTLQGVVGGFVFLAYYWTGFTDDSATVLEICDSRKTANAVLREHKRTRDTEAEFQNRANWWVRRERVRTANEKAEG